MRMYKPEGREGFPSTEAERIEAISHEFSIRLSHALGDDTLREVVRLNATPRYEGCCASHDYLDANMVMLMAMRAWGYKYGLGGEDATFELVWNAAWDQAKEYRFDLP
jgi:hypothetical protein